jgi:hypothetical protein
VRATLEGAEVIEVGAPSQEDALQMLLAAAGVTANAGVPAGASEVVRFCKRLPV